MRKITGIVTKDSYYLKNGSNLYLICFTVNVDSKIYIFGEVLVHFKTCRLLTLNKGDKVVITGKVNINSGLYIKALFVSKLPFYA